MTGGVGVRNKAGAELSPTDPTDICAGDTDGDCSGNKGEIWTLATTLVGAAEVVGCSPIAATERG